MDYLTLFEITTVAGFLPVAKGIVSRDARAS